MLLRFIYPCCSMYWYFIPFLLLNIIPLPYTKFVHLFISWWGFISLGCIPRSCIAGPYGNLVFKLIRFWGILYSTVKDRNTRTVYRFPQKERTHLFHCLLSWLSCYRKYTWQWEAGGNDVWKMGLRVRGTLKSDIQCYSCAEPLFFLSSNLKISDFHPQADIPGLHAKDLTWIFLEKCPHELAPSPETRFPK